MTVEMLVAWVSWLINTYPLEVLLGLWLTLAGIALYSTTRLEYRKRSYYGSVRRHRRDSNRFLKGKGKNDV